MPHGLGACSLANVDASHEVGIMLEATEYTPEAIAIAVSLVDHTTPRTSLTGKLRGYLDHRYPGFKGFVADKVLEPSECPGVVEIPLSFSSFCPVSDVAQVFKGNGFTECSGFLDNKPTYVVQHPVSEPFLPSAHGFEPSFGRMGASLLDLFTLVHKMPAPLLQRGAAEYCAGRKTGKVVEATIYTDNTVNLPGQGFFPNGKVEVKAVPSMDDFTLSEVPPGEVPCLVMTSNYGDINPALNSNHRELVRVEPVAGAVEMEGITFEFLSLPMPAPFPGYFTDKPGTEWGLASKVMVKLFTTALERQIKKTLVFIQSLKEYIIKVWGKLEGNGFGYLHMPIVT